MAMINPTPEQSKAVKDLVNKFIDSETENKLGEESQEVIDMKVNVENIKNNVKAVAGETREDFANRADASVNELKDMLMGTVKYIGDVLGMTGLYNEIVDIYTSNRGVVKTAQSIDKAVKRKIRMLKLVDPDDKLGKVAALKQVVYDGVYEEEYTQSIFMSIANTIVWITKKVARKLRDWKIFSTDAKENILGEIGASIANCFRSISNFVINVGKATGSLLLFAGSYVVAGAIKLGCLVIRAIATVLSKIKGWIDNKLAKITEDDFDDEDIFEEDEDDYDFDQMVEDANN